MQNCFERLAACEVVVIGDVMLDRYVTGSVRRISPEAPVPVLSRASRRAVAGGAANVAMAIRKLGCGVTLVGVIGDDASGNDLRQILTEAGVKLRLTVASGRPTTEKTRFISSEQQLLRVDEEVSDPIGPETAATVILDARASILRADVVILSDYQKGVLTHSVIQSVIDTAKDRPVIVDPKKPSFGAYRGATVITPNEAELAAGTGTTDLFDGAKRAMADSGCQALLVTRSEKGVALFRPGKEPMLLPAHARDVVDVSGAGDTVIGTLAAFIAAGADLGAAVTVANRAAAVAVSKMGTAIVSVAELRAALTEIDHKRATVDAAADMVAAWKAMGLRVGFTNGCFDLIHPGHVNLLRKAKAQCDRLVVGLNSDDSVSRLKGPSRPIQTEESRATVLSGMCAVDLVVVFDEDTPEGVIHRLTPDILFKGADYHIDDIVGGEWVRAHGGDVRTVDIEEGHSTSSLIERARR